MRKTVNRLCCMLLAAILGSFIFSVFTFGESIIPYLPNTVRKLDLPAEDHYYGDPFLTGMAGAETYVTRSNTEAKSGTGKIVPSYVHLITTTYPEGNYIHRIVAEFGNDERKSLVQYTITYHVYDGYDIAEYTFSFSGDTNKMLQGFYTCGDTRLETGINGDFEHWYSFDIMQGKYVRYNGSAARLPSRFVSSYGY